MEALERYAFASRKTPEYMHWRLSQCQRCDLLYVDPAPRSDDLAMLYRQADFDSRRSSGDTIPNHGEIGMVSLRRVSLGKEEETVVSQGY